MSSPYPVLGEKPIDQWRVTDLKEELKRRKLATKGLKDDLIRRLDEALRAEKDISEEEKSGNEMDTEKEDFATPGKDGTEEKEVFQDGDNTDEMREPAGNTEMDVDKKQEADVLKEEETVQKEKNFGNDEVANGFDDEAAIKGKTEDVGPDVIGTSVVIDNEETVHKGRESGEEVANENDCEAKLQVNCEDTEPNAIETPVVLDAKDQDDSEIGKLDNNVTVVDADASLEKLDQGKIQGGESVFIRDTVEVVSQTTIVGGSVETITTESRSKVTVTSSSVEPPQEDAVLNDSNPDNQVSEVSPSLGFQVKSDSISTDSVSINEKNELKDNLNADNFHIDHDSVMPDVVQQSSRDVPHSGGDTHPLDDKEPCGNDGSIEQIDDINTTNEDLSKKNDSADGGSSEKLNLDRSSGDDSMDEDALESKQVESNHISVEVEDKSELTKVHLKKGGNSVDEAGVSFSPATADLPKNNSVALPADKRKLEADQDTVKNSEPPKRRRWNTEPIKVPDPPSSNVTPLTTPKDVFQPKFPKRSFNRSDSVLSGGDTPKERVVPPTAKAPTTSLKIDNFLRPFTLKAVQELLGKTGTVCSFWMDHIKTHCYVTFSSAEEAIETRNALYNLQWPPNGGKLLVADFVDPQEVKIRAEAPQTSATPVNKPAPPSAPSLPQPSPRQNVLKQQLPPPPSALPPPPPSGPHTVKERLPLPPPPPLAKKPDPPIVTLDDLFKKTKATPRIYYLPLSEEQVAAKLAAKGKNLN